MVDEKLLRELTEAVVREVAPEAVILFGSYAVGSASPESDVDLLVIESEPFGTKRDRRPAGGVAG